MYLNRKISPASSGAIPSIRNTDVRIIASTFSFSSNNTVDRNCVYHCFTTNENINSDRFIEFMDNFSLGIRKETVVVLDNSTVNKCRKVKDCLQRWKERASIYSISLLTPRISTSRKRFGES